jgi:hypothetical protein
MLSGDSRVHVRGAARIKVDGRGGLTVFDAEKGGTEVVNVGRLRSLTIQSVSGLSSLSAAVIH